MSRRERFEARVPFRPEEGCWLWRGSLAVSGYGRLGKDYAHRLAYEFWIGPIPEGREIEHLCEVKRCVRPAHLRASTHSENMGTSAHRIGYGEFQRRKAQCPAGHPYSPENTYVHRGKRTCKRCKIENQRKRRAKK